jgi:hypothetical protein
MDGPSVTDQKPTVFFHVMKCGGTSVRAGLATGALGERPGTVSSTETRRELGNPQIFELDGDTAKVAAGGKHADNWAFRDALLPYVLLAMHPSVVLGHFRYRDRYRDFLDSAHFVTVLRDPVERIVSLYKYRRYHEGIDIPVSTGFDEFIANSRWAKEGHAFVDTFVGRDGLDPRSDEAVAAAVANLGRYAVVGFIDRLDDFSSQVTARIGKPVKIPMLNASPAPADADIEPDALERARLVCAPDIQVYEQARAGFA